MLQLNMGAIASRTGASPDEIIDRFRISQEDPPSPRQVAAIMIWSGLTVREVVSVVA